MKTHYQEIKRDSKTGWKAKRNFLFKGRKEKRKTEALVTGLRIEEDEREKKIRKLESQMFCLLRNCQ
jgi:predicted secreted Zn-dependent protease